MAKKQVLFKTRGMNRDLSVSAFNPEFSFENRNLRLSTNEGNTLLSWVNERGTSEVSLWSESTPSQSTTISGVPIGSAVINNNIVLFTVNGVNNYIYKLYYNGDHSKMLCKELYHGALGFDTDYPLETLVSYESDDAQKVYWTDGVNQPRVINIANTDRVYDATSFDFIPELPFNETVKVVKLLGANGMFAPGVIQYAFTYFYKYGQETNIFYTTPLYYVSPKDRGGSPEEKVDNAFKITVEINANSAKFDYIRIYSIQRTSINGTPIVKRIQDIKLTGLTTTGNNPIVVSYTDTGTTGDTIDPTELLYKGGESIKALTMEQKDGTLFLGNLETKKSFLTSSLRESIQRGMQMDCVQRHFFPQKVSTGAYEYYNHLTANPESSTINVADESRIVPCGGFKYGDYYRLGLQFQHKSGWWSEPVELWDVYGNEKHDWLQELHPGWNSNAGKCSVPIFSGIIASTVVSNLYSTDYRAVRPVAVFPSLQDRVTICQGVVNPTMYTPMQRSNKDLYAQASWLFRAYRSNDNDCLYVPNPSSAFSQITGAVSPKSQGMLRYIDGYNDIDPTDNTKINMRFVRQMEIQGCYGSSADDDTEKFFIDDKLVTFHSPDIEFDDQLQTTDFNGFVGVQLGQVEITNVLSDISIQTETPTISSLGSGFIHRSFSVPGPFGIISGLFYEDFIVDDSEDNPTDAIFQAYEYEKSPVKWPVYMWQKNGSLNNDITRPSDKGIASAILKKKIISNLRYANTIWGSGYAASAEHIGLFASDQPEIIKINDNVYMGNIDTVINPKKASPLYFSFADYQGHGLETKNLNTPFNYSLEWKVDSGEEERQRTIFGTETTETVKFHGIYKLEDSNGYSWEPMDNGWVGDSFEDLCAKKEAVRMKYKSTPHLVFESKTNSETPTSNITWVNNSLPIMEIQRVVDHATIYGGKSEDSLRGNVWLPAGEPVVLNSGTPAEVKWEYGDTYYQRWDCLKTYPFTKEDINQVVEIGSFMLETRVNIDGRYDRNRGQINNLNMSPQNFNLLNPVYSQLNNFFTYRITEIPDANTRNEDTIKYPNYITWSKTKEAGADVDLWTNITMASVLELDGNMGSINKIARLNDQIIVFQDSGVSQVLYNENVQISTVDGVPIEIANSGKVQGKRYLSNTVGCSNKWSVVNTPMGIYFIDSNEKAIYLLNGKLQNISQTGGFNSWCKQHIPSSDVRWEPINFGGGTGNYVGYYDRMNQDVLFIGTNEALAYSERVGAFTSFYDYGSTPYLVNLNDEGFWLRSNNINTTVWKHQGSDAYCKFFGVNKPYSITLVGNPEAQRDKTFTNLEFRACIEGEGTTEQGEFTSFFTPFDSIETWNEYQHGIADIDIRNGRDLFKHHLMNSSSSSLIRKFRIWRCDIPRDNAVVDPYTESAMGITRLKRHPLDRMRNPWLYLKLEKEAAADGKALAKTEIHDFVMSYYS